MARLSIIILFAIVGLLGCSKVNSSDLVGTWSMDEASLRNLSSDLKVASASLVLNENGTFTAADMPGLTSFPSEPPQLVSGHGAWKLMTEGSKQFIQLNFQELRRKSDTHVFHDYGGQVYVSDTWFSTPLYYILGDVDDGQTIDLVKNRSRNPS